MLMIAPQGLSPTQGLERGEGYCEKTKKHGPIIFLYRWSNRSLVTKYTQIALDQPV